MRTGGRHSCQLDTSLRYSTALVFRAIEQTIFSRTSCAFLADHDQLQASAHTYPTPQTFKRKPNSKPCCVRLRVQDQVRNELASGKVFLQGGDVQGRTVFVVLAKQQEMGRPEETKRFICYTLDNAIAAADPDRNELGQFLCLFDLSGRQQQACFARRLLSWPIKHRLGPTLAA